MARVYAQAVAETCRADRRAFDARRDVPGDRAHRPDRAGHPGGRPGARARRALPPAPEPPAAADARAAAGSTTTSSRSSTGGSGPYLHDDAALEEVAPGVDLPFMHRPLSRYVQVMGEVGLLIDDMDEPPPPPGFLAAAWEYAEAATIPRSDADPRPSDGVSRAALDAPRRSSRRPDRPEPRRISRARPTASALRAAAGRLLRCCSCLRRCCRSLNDPARDAAGRQRGQARDAPRDGRTGALDPDIGYWAADLDPTGCCTRSYYTESLRSGCRSRPCRCFASSPLYEVGGAARCSSSRCSARVLVALAARGLGAPARRRATAGPRSGRSACSHRSRCMRSTSGSTRSASGSWCGRSSSSVDVAAHRAGWRAARSRPVLLFGAAATLRTEALVYSRSRSSSLLATCSGRRPRVRSRVVTRSRSRRRGWCRLARQPTARARVIGARSALRAGRAASTAAAAGDARDAHRRGAHHLRRSQRLLDPDRLGHRRGYRRCWSARRCVRSRRVRRRAALGVARVRGRGRVLVRRAFCDGLGFLPGLLTASPLAAAGIVLVWHRRGCGCRRGRAASRCRSSGSRSTPGTCGPQWGGRYALTPGCSSRSSPSSCSRRRASRWSRCWRCRCS